jgi:transcriptional regulator with XRE-family HTH domain
MGACVSKYAKIFGKNVAARRKQKGWTQTEFAEKVGLSKHSQISAYESGKIPPGLELMEKWGEVLGTTPAELLMENFDFANLDPERLRLVQFILTADRNQLKPVIAAALPFLGGNSENKKSASGIR